MEAQCEEQSGVAQRQDQILVLEQENDLRKLKARLDQKAKSEEEITIAAAEENRAKVEQVLQVLRTQLEQLRNADRQETRWQ
jgi:flotillin